VSSYGHRLSHGYLIISFYSWYRHVSRNASRHISRYELRLS